MKFPDVTELGAVTIEDAGRFVVLMVKDDWEPDNGHDSDHARGGCECPCSSPLDVLLAEAKQ
jgi:hypothetical protein